MFNRVKFVVNKILLQTSKNKKSFVKINKCNKYNFNSISTRKFSSYSNPKQPNNPFNYLVVTMICSFLFFYKKDKKN